MIIKTIKKGSNLTNIKQPAIKIIKGLNIKDLSKKKVNITLENYNHLLAGESVSTYNEYNADTVYNITDAPKADNPNPPKITELLFGSISNNTDGSLPENEETEATFLNTETPSLSIRYYKPVIQPGESLNVRYYVDSKRADRLYRNKIEQTFTVVIKDPNNNILYKGTTFAGEFQTSIKFNSSITGETWFSIQAINNLGVGSATQFFDLLIKQPETAKVYQMKADDLITYDIQPNIEDAIIGYKNKVGFSNLFRKVKEDGFNEIKLFNPGGNTIYYIDYHKNISETPGEIDLGSSTYEIWWIKSGEIKRKIQLIPRSTFAINNTTYEVGADVLQWIWDDGAKLYRDENDKIKVNWKGRWLRDTDIESENKPLRTYRKGELESKTKITVDGEDKWVPIYQTMRSGYYYVVNSTVPHQSGKGYYGGDFMKLPNNFTIDLNKATLKAVTCYDIRLKGSVIKFELNFDTHIKNGNLQGCYYDYCFPKAYLQNSAGVKAGCVEFLNVVLMQGSRYCSMENVDISWGLGYESGVGELENYTLKGKYDSVTNREPYDSSNPNGPIGAAIRFNTLGYIDYQGNTKPCGIIEELREDSTERAYHATSISLLYTGRLIPCEPRLVLKDGTEMPLDEISIEPGGYGQFGSGKQHEFFIHFYDSNQNFIKTIKSSMYYTIKIPEGSKFIRLSAYGLSRINSSGQLVAVLDNLGRGRALQILKENVFYFSKNTWYRNCSWHDTRSIAMQMSYAKGHLWENCRYDRIAIEPLGIWSITKIFGDFEEGWESTDLVAIYNCTATRGQSSVTGDKGQVMIAANCIRNLDFRNNTSIGMEERCGIETALYLDSTIGTLRIQRSGMQERPTIIYKGLKIPYELKLGYENNLYTATHRDLGYERLNRCDDIPERVIALTEVEGPKIQYIKGASQIILNLKDCTFAS